MQTNNPFFATALAAAIAFTFTFTAFAQSPGQQSTNGEVGINYAAQTGNANNGGFATGYTDNTFYSVGNNTAHGTLTTTGSGFSKPTLAPGLSGVDSRGKVVSHGEASGDQSTDLHLTGSQQAASWTGVGDDDNFADSGGVTNSMFDGHAAGSGPLSGDGAASTASRSTSQTTITSPDESSSRVATSGGAKAQVQMNQGSSDCQGPAPTTSVAANGHGGLDAQSFNGNVNGTFAGADLIGFVQFGATGQSTASGGFSLTGETHSKICPDGTCAYSSASMSGSAHGTGN